MLICRAIKTQVADRQAANAPRIGTKPVGGAGVRLLEWADGMNLYLELRSNDKLLAAFLPCPFRGGLLTALFGPWQEDCRLVIDKTRGR